MKGPAVPPLLPVLRALAVPLVVALACAVAYLCLLGRSWQVAVLVAVLATVKGVAAYLLLRALTGTPRQP